MPSKIADGQPERPEHQRGAKRSLYERVLADEQTKHAYFNTTQGMLRGSPSHTDMDEIRRVLDDNGVVYLYEPESSRPRPTFYAPGIISIGLAEISRTAVRLSEAS